MKANRVILVGDMMIDRYIYWESDREIHGAPVLKNPKEEDVPGGSSNVARNLTALGAEVVYLNRFVAPHYSIKERHYVNGKLLCRMDDDYTKPLHEDAEDRLLYELEQHAETSQVLLLSDYGKSVLRNPKRFIDVAKRCGLPVIVDPKKNDWSVYAGATLIKPNLEEWATRTDKTVFPYILLSKGPKGMALYTDNCEYTIKPVDAEPVDSCGCGDSVVATLAAFWGQMPIKELCHLSNRAGALAVTKHGTAIVTAEELLS